MDEGWFAGREAGDATGGAAAIREGSTETPREWPTLGAATRTAAREAAAERERADDKQLIHAVRAMDDIGKHYATTNK